jgi:uncharacterized Tic20 family protein
MHDATNRKILSIACHVAIFFNPTVVSVGVPILVAVLSEDPVVKDNAKEAINFHIFVWLCFLITGILSLACIGLPLLFLTWLASVILPAWAIVCVLTEPHVAYRYPVSLRLL